MQDTDQFARLLHIQQPWRVSLVEVDEKDLTTVHVGIDDDLELECPLCNARSPRYDRRRRTWRHLDTMEFSTFVTAQVPRINCPTHGVRQLRVPWAEDSSRYTLAFESFVIDWLEHDASTSAVAELTRLSWGAVAAIMQRAVERGLQRRELAPPVHLAIDETSFQKRHEYVTVVTDQQTGAVVHVADNRTVESIETYFMELTSEDCARIESVTMDMWPAYIATVSRYVPNAAERICFDEFHIAKYVGDAVDKVRREEHRTLSAAGYDWLKGTKHRWLQNLRQCHARTGAALRSFGAAH